MNPVLQGLLDRVKDGLAWANADGKITFINANAEAFTGMKAGETLPNSPLARAVAVIASGKLQKEIQLEFEPPAGAKQLLVAQVGPGMANGEAWIYFKPPPAYGEALALHNLMTVIKSDLGDPLKQFSSSLKNALENDNPEAFKKCLEKVAEVTDTVTHLTDLAELWGSENLLAQDRIEIWPLLQSTWLQLEGDALTRKLTVRLINRIDEFDMPVVYASEFWLKRVVAESLGAAMKAVPNGGTLDIELRQMGPRILIVFRNSGMWPSRADNARVLATPADKAPKKAEAAKPSGQKGGSPQQSAKDLIGLHLCQRILSLHGGQMGEEEEDGLRNFLIDLPTGAPYMAETTALDAAQAQRYAADLAVLMARRRQKSAA